MSVIWFRLYMILFGAVLLVSCSLAVRPGDSFLSSRDDFAQRLRWQDYPGAARYLAEPERSAFLEQLTNLNDLRFVGVEPESAELSDENRQAVTLTVLEYYRLPSVVVQKFRLRQEWVFQENAWRVVSPFPELP